MREYGDKRDYKKIDLYINAKYHGTTTWAKNVKEAKEKLAEKLSITLKSISAEYQK